MMMNISHYFCIFSSHPSMNIFVQPCFSLKASVSLLVFACRQSIYLHHLFAISILNYGHIRCWIWRYRKGFWYYTLLFFKGLTFAKGIKHFFWRKLTFNSQKISYHILVRTQRFNIETPFNIFSFNTLPTWKIFHGWGW